MIIFHRKGYGFRNRFAVLFYKNTFPKDELYDTRQLVYFGIPLVSLGIARLSLNKINQLFLAMIHFTQGMYLIQLFLPLVSNALLEEALIHAAPRGDTTRIEALLAWGVPVDARNGDALVGATMAGRYPAVSVLLAAGADINARQQGALRWAFEWGSAKIQQEFCKYSETARDIQKAGRRPGRVYMKTVP